MTPAVEEIITSLYAKVEESIISEGCRKAAPAAAAIPTYRSSDDDTLAHHHQKVVPDFVLGMGPAREGVRVLWDTGAFYNIMTKATATRLRAKLITGGPMPSMELADSHSTGPIARANIEVDFAGQIASVEFHIMESSHYDAMFGAHFMN